MGGIAETAQELKESIQGVEALDDSSHEKPTPGLKEQGKQE